MLSKIVAAVVSPLGTALILALLGWVLAGAGRPALRRAGRALVALGLGWLLLWSLPVASDGLRGWIEAQAGPRTVEAVPAAPVMVVLGGGVAGPRAPLRPYPNLNAAGDRLWHAARLYRAGKAPRLVLSGGVTRTGDGSEAEAMRRFLLDMGVPAPAIELEDASKNTTGNAVFTAQALKAQGVDTVILVTSALHMPRARRLFDRAGLKVHPAPADHEIIDMPFDLLRVVPDADALEGSARAFKELFGRLVGR
jgi:uncharacterized SAM-binding protein YcdF (DUF218 family)